MYKKNKCFLKKLGVAAMVPTFLFSMSYAMAFGSNWTAAANPTVNIRTGVANALGCGATIGSITAALIALPKNLPNDNHGGGNTTTVTKLIPPGTPVIITAGQSGAL